MFSLHRLAWIWQKLDFDHFQSKIAHSAWHLCAFVTCWILQMWSQIRKMVVRKIMKTGREKERERGEQREREMEGGREKRGFFFFCSRAREYDELYWPTSPFSSWPLPSPGSRQVSQINTTIHVSSTLNSILSILCSLLRCLVIQRKVVSLKHRRF